MAEIKGSQTIKGITYNTGSSVTLNRSAYYHTSADGTNAKNLSGLSTSSEYYPDTFVGYSTTYDYAPYHVSYNTSWEGYWFTKDAFPEASITINYYSNGADYCTFEGKQVSVGSNTKVASDTFYYETTDSNGLANVQNSSYLYLSRTGYSATGNWGTSTSGGTLIGENDSQSGKTLANKLGVDVSSGSGSKNLYAQWVPNTYTVTFDANGGSVDITEIDATYDSAYGTLPTPTRTGYTFDWWHTDIVGGEKIDSSTSVSMASDHTLYAHWTANTYTIEYNANGGTGTTSSQTHTYNTAKNLTSNAFVRTGYTFTGWNTKPNGSGNSYTDGQSVKNLSSVSGATVTLYAQWEENILFINYKSNYATYAIVDGVENTEVSANEKDIVVRRKSEYKYATPIPNGLHKYSNEGDDTYMKRTRYDATGYWCTTVAEDIRLEGDKTNVIIYNGGIAVGENKKYSTGQELAEDLGLTLEDGNKTIDLYAHWILLASRISVFLPDENGEIMQQKGLVHIYDDDGYVHYGILTVYDSEGNAHVVI